MKKQTYDLEERLLIKKSELLNDILEKIEIAVECSVSDICFSFDVRRLSFNVTCEGLQNNLALMGVKGYKNLNTTNYELYFTTNCLLLRTVFYYELFFTTNCLLLRTINQQS